jgi:FkbM family methyltransferase
MQPERLRKVSRITRRFMRGRTPVLFGLSKLLLRVVAPKDRHYPAPIVAEVDDGVMALDLNASLEYTVFFRGCHEPEVGRIIRWVTPPGGVCLDVGANVGAHTLTMARAVGPGGRVVAIEPQPELFRRLARNVALNHLAQVDLVHAAVSDRDGEVEFHSFRPGAFKQGISSLAPVQGETVPTRVPAVCGATLLRELDLASCDFIKIDVEGFEPLVLDQLWPLIARCRPHMIFEHRAGAWSKAGGDIAPVLEGLGALGYDMYLVRKRATVALTGAIPPECELLCVPTYGAVRFPPQAPDEAPTDRASARAEDRSATG